MIGRLSAIVLLLATFGIRAEAADRQPLNPSGKWAIAYENEMCILSRDFGAGERKLALAMQGLPTVNHLTLALAVTDHAISDQGEAKLTLLPSNRTVSARFTRAQRANSSGVLVLMPFDRSELPNLAASTGFALTAGKALDVVLASGSMAKALTALKTCEDQLVRSWGFDPAVIASVSRKAEPITSPAIWVVNSDYPPDAKRAGAQGTSNVRWTIDTDGVARNCIVIQSAGFASLDQKACAMVELRVRYRPALDAQGKPVAVFASRRFVWGLP